ncbi:DUF6197 family protein [Salinispora arenicola]|uniref:DUF6197 family protein n=1 Tax=Salinispora arenicola TaxID=168697 RepID=UPI0027DAC033|nr:hypothetical protein [Salinispora arenicola]
MSAPAVLPPHTSPADVLAAAADVMERLGKCEDDYTDERGRVCALGALCMVTLGRATPPDPDIITPAYQEEAYIAAERALYRWLNHSAGGGGEPLTCGVTPTRSRRWWLVCGPPPSMPGR